MRQKTALKAQAIELRKQGHTYSEILRKIPVAKSTLSLWLRDVGLAKEQFQKYTEKKRLSSLRGGLARRNTRITQTEEIYKKAESEIRTLSKRELWLIGIALYWAEGSKEKEEYPRGRTELINSDPRMIKLFLSWLTCIKVDEKDVFFDIWIHENHSNRLEEVKKYWNQKVGISIDKLTKIYFKRHKPKTNRKNVGNMYNGILRVRVSCSSTLLRQIEGWTRGICKNYWEIV